MIYRFLKTTYFNFLRNSSSTNYKLLHQPFYRFCESNQPNSQEVTINQKNIPDFIPNKSHVSNMEFKSETRKILDIVAKSLYTDKQVFIRQLLSNASDALQKMKFHYLEEGKQPQQLFIIVSISNDKKQISFFDNGIGMSKQQLIQNLGTIARSGSLQYVQLLKKKGQTPENIIGQFGVGFYSTFIVGDYIEVISKSILSDKAYCWSSDGFGQFQIGQVSNCQFQNGTQINIHLKPECEQFCKKMLVQQTIQKFSNFISFPIYLNGTKINLVQAIWTRNKNQIQEEEYEKFCQYLTGSKQYYSKIHYKVDVPLQIKSILFIPQRHKQRFGQFQQTQVNLYSRRILIKKNCKQLLPRYLRFVKGIVDCEDLPLNISRQNYQDSSLMNKLNSILTSKIISHIKSEAENNPQKFNQWMSNFSYFFKEGILQNNNSQLIELLRFLNTHNSKYISLQEYIEYMKPNQKQIYYLSAPNVTAAMINNYAQPFIQNKIPIIVSNHPMDEFIFSSVQKYKNYPFVNIETSIGNANTLFKQEKTKQNKNQISQQEFSSFSLWIKNQLQPVVTTVNKCKKPIKGPALIISPVSHAMRSMKIFQQLQANNQPGSSDFNKNLTMQINTNNDIIKKLNQARKTNIEKASSILKIILNNCMISSGFQITDIKGYTSKIENLIELNLDSLKNKTVQHKLERRPLQGKK